MIINTPSINDAIVSSDFISLVLDKLRWINLFLRRNSGGSSIKRFIWCRPNSGYATGRTEYLSQKQYDAEKRFSTYQQYILLRCLEFWRTLNLFPGSSHRKPTFLKTFRIHRSRKQLHSSTEWWQNRHR